MVLLRWTLVIFGCWLSAVFKVSPAISSHSLSNCLLSLFYLFVFSLWNPSFAFKVNFLLSFISSPYHIFFQNLMHLYLRHNVWVAKLQTSNRLPLLSLLSSVTSSPQQWWRMLSWLNVGRNEELSKILATNSYWLTFQNVFHLHDFQSLFQHWNSKVQFPKFKATACFY